MTAAASSAGAQTVDPGVDYLTFAAGAVPVEVRGPGVELGADFEQAIRAIDGSPLAATLYRRPATADTWVEFVYVLPAPTTFTSFVVPGIGETPSPSQTFTAAIEVHGAATPGGPSALLASGALAVPDGDDASVTLALSLAQPVTEVTVRLTGGNEAGATFFEFSELIARGTQDPVERVDHFDGLWDAPGGVVELRQEGATVTGCADRGRKTLTGTVDGNLLFGTLEDNTSGVRGAVILARAPDGSLRGLRSDNGAPFRMYGGPVAADGTPPPCGQPAEATFGCGDIVHGIHFAFDSAELLPSSGPVLDALADGLRAETRAVVIEGHTSTEGTTAYNDDLSNRRAAAVVAALVERGVSAPALTAVGRGESTPIAREDTEAGRALNRRVEVHCAD